MKLLHLLELAEIVLPKDQPMRFPIQNLRNRRPTLRHGQLLGRACLKLPAVFDDRRTRCHAASFKTCRRATGQQARRDYEDGELARDHWDEVLARVKTGRKKTCF
jgi:hypothetical protein